MSDGLFWGPVGSNVVDTQSLMFQTRTPSSGLDKDAFLRLLITQMQHQDPLNPMDDRDFLGQMAQFSALEQMQNLNNTYLQTQAYSMIGKQVYAYYLNPATEEYEDVNGTVAAVTMKNGQAYLFVDGHDIPLSAVHIVGQDNFSANQLSQIHESVTNTRNQGYVGRFIQALLMDANGNVTDYVEGRVDYVKQNGGQSVLVVGNKEVFPHEVASVSDGPLLIGHVISLQVTIDGERTVIENVPITDITISNNRAHLHAGGHSVPIDKINYVMEALAWRGKHINVNGVAGIVDSVTIRFGIPYLGVDGREVSYLELLETL